MELLRTTDDGDPAASKIKTGRNSTAGTGGGSRVHNAAGTAGTGGSGPHPRPRFIPGASNRWVCDNVYTSGPSMLRVVVGLNLVAFLTNFGRSLHPSLTGELIILRVGNAVL